MAISSSPANATSSQRLTPMPGVSQRRRFIRSSSRWNTETGPKSRSRSHVASSSAITIERWKPPVHPIAIVRRVLPSPT